MWCHLLLGAPAWALLIFFVLPLPVAAPLYVAIVVASLAMYRWLWREMQRPPVVGPEAMVGQECVAVEDIRHRGLVRCGNELWTARSPVPLRAGQRARVMEARGATLAVRPVEDTSK